jgi:hypothetical protein
MLTAASRMKTRHQRPGPDQHAHSGWRKHAPRAQKSCAEQSAVETFTELADLHVAVKQAEPIPSHANRRSGVPARDLPNYTP